MIRVKTISAAVTAGVLATAAISAGAAQHMLPEPEAAAVWNHLEQENYRKNWSHWPGKKALYKGTEPHGMLLTTYVNKKAMQALKQGGGEMPTGAIIVKENYSPAKELKAVTVMYQAPQGYNPEHNDWFWLKRLANGKVEASGKVDSCQSCHQASQRGYLMTPLPE